jgi:hypothetical protein
VGKVVQSLQSVNCHDSCAHGPERQGPFARLVGIWLGWFWLELSGSSWFGSWYVVGVKPLCMVLGLATGGMLVSSIGLATGKMHVSSIGFGYMWDACERWSVWLQV